MKKFVLFVVLLSAISLGACTGNAVPTPIPTVVLSSGSQAASGGVSASGEVVPEAKASLSFPLTGTVKTVEVKAGDKVTKGQTLVTLDTVLLEAQVKEAQASLVAAQANEKYL